MKCKKGMVQHCWKTAEKLPLLLSSAPHFGGSSHLNAGPSLWNDFKAVHRLHVRTYRALYFKRSSITSAALLKVVDGCLAKEN